MPLSGQREERFSEKRPSQSLFGGRVHPLKKNALETPPIIELGTPPINSGTPPINKYRMKLVIRVVKRYFYHTFYPSRLHTRVHIQ